MGILKESGLNCDAAAYVRKKGFNSELFKSVSWKVDRADKKMDYGWLLLLEEFVSCLLRQKSEGVGRGRNKKFVLQITEKPPLILAGAV